ncbi:MAG TPA: hypothetical protein VMH39_07945 [Gemmatimonadaceae bacterium]|nr:hypothetical protein [Gemmatimonadaceae bacterium]
MGTGVGRSDVETDAGAGAGIGAVTGAGAARKVGDIILSSGNVAGRATDESGVALTVGLFD